MLKLYGIIYLATLPSGKVYIGCTKHKLGTRKSQHRHEAISKGTCSKFYNAIRYYGYYNIKWEILASCFTAKALFELEAYFIKEYDSISTGYNQLSGSSPYLREDKRSPEWREAKRTLNSGKSNPMYGKTHNPETRQLISQSQKGLKLGIKRPPFTAAHKTAIGASSKGRIPSKETRLKLSKAGKDRVVSKESRDKAANSVPHRIPIKCLNNNTVYCSQTAAARALGLNTMSIHNHLKGRNESVKGYKFVKVEK